MFVSPIWLMNWLNSISLSIWLNDDTGRNECKLNKADDRENKNNIFFFVHSNNFVSTISPSAHQHHRVIITFQSVAIKCSGVHSIVKHEMLKRQDYVIFLWFLSFLVFCVSFRSLWARFGRSICNRKSTDLFPLSRRLCDSKRHRNGDVEKASRMLIRAHTHTTVRTEPTPKVPWTREFSVVFPFVDCSKRWGGATHRSDSDQHAVPAKCVNILMQTIQLRQPVRNRVAIEQFHSIKAGINE